MTTLTRIGTQTDILGESPLWHEQQRALYWVDIRRPALRKLHLHSGQLESWPLPDLVGSIAFCDDGGLLVALPDRIALFDPATRALQTLVRPAQQIEGHRFNDGRCDRQGRFWVGTMHNVTRAPEGVLYRLAAGRELQAVRSGIRIPNSLAWSPDGGIMYFADSLRYAIFAYDFDAETGEMRNERVFARTAPPAFPDGSTVDAEGYLWNAEFNGSRIVRYAPDGRIDRVVETPTRRPTCCAFGGPDLDILYVTTCSQQMTAAELAAEPLAGALLALEPGVRGLPEPRFVTQRSTETESNA
ncbi:MAG TPA: SMP-30/gluconolactonase/LRE family protein [Casimicrobiaceae bacterium]|nr:SMP-30/gluconolactonase/LRE family protein [Casimicrobiaceae bacterium]